MKYCEKCNISVRGNSNICPLCQNPLKGEGESPVFPKIPTIYKQFKLFFKLMLLGSVVGALASVFTNIIISGKMTWSLFALLGIGCFWVIFIIAIKKRHAIPQNITFQVFAISALSIVWDRLTGHNGWSADYVIPIACTIAIVALITLAKVVKIDRADCLSWLAINILLGIVPIVLLIMNKLSVLIPSAICFSASVISFLILILFEKNAFIQELKRRLHI